MRLDRLDPYLTTFTASVTAARDSEDGTWVTLDRSAFYPTAGGQPHDTGRLDDVEVSNVESRDGAVWHRVSAPLAVGAAVVGRIDWDRRFRHMQRHTGQHLLSQAFVRVGLTRGIDLGTKSVSIKGPECTLDLSGDPDTGVDADACASAELEANEQARRALPVSTFEVAERDLHEFRLRRPTKVGGLVRLVAIGDYDLAACGGTHVRNSAELLPILVLGSERVRGGLTRVSFRVGAEAVADAAAKHAVVRDLGTALSSTALELPAQVARLQAELTQTREALTAARGTTVGFLADGALQAAAEFGGARLARVVLREREAVLLDPLVARLQDVHGVVAMCASVDGDKVRLAFTAGPGTGLDVRPALQAALAIVAGRGGGRSDRATGAGSDAARLEEALDSAAKVLGSCTATP